MKQHACRRAAPVLAAVAAMVGWSGEASAQRGTVSIPRNTVVRLELAESLNSRSARRGDLFMARLNDRDRSGFPERTRFEGSVIDVRRADRDGPGVLGIKIHRAILPDGTLVPVNGTLAALSEDDVRRTSGGRLEARDRKSGKMDMKWIGYGAAGGAVLGTVLGGSDDLLKGALLGALGGAAYGYLNKDRGSRSARYEDVQLSRGTAFGVRVHHSVAFRDSDRYRYASSDPYYEDRYDRDRYSDTDEDRYRNRDDRNRDDRYRDDRYRDDRTDGRIYRDRYDPDRDYDRDRR